MRGRVLEVVLPGRGNWLTVRKEGLSGGPGVGGNYTDFAIK